MEDEKKQARDGYKKEEVVEAYQNAMSFWDRFWRLAFDKLGYRSPALLP
jgi:hypothetical protein